MQTRRPLVGTTVTLTTVVHYRLKSKINLRRHPERPRRPWQQIPTQRLRHVAPVELVERIVHPRPDDRVQTARAQQVRRAKPSHVVPRYLDPVGRIEHLVARILPLRVELEPRHLRHSVLDPGGRAQFRHIGHALAFGAGVARALLIRIERHQRQVVVQAGQGAALGRQLDAPMRLLARAHEDVGGVRVLETLGFQTRRPTMPAARSHCA